MSAKGRPTVNKKTERLEIRLAPSEMALIDECAKKLKVCKSDVLIMGVNVLKADLDKKKSDN
jgi:hypothetical protein